MAFSTHDSVSTSPTNTFATLNPLIPDLGGTSVSISNGNLNFSASNNPEVYFTFNADNYYFEVIDNISGNNFSLLILSSNESKIGATEYYNITNHSRIYNTGVIDNRGSANLTVSSGSLFSIASGDIISVYKKDKSTLILKKNGTSATVEINISGLSDDFIIGLISYTSSLSTSYSLNFGQDSSFGGVKTSGSANATDANGIGDFYYAPPTGALALCTSNLPAPAIDPAVDDLPEDFFKCTIYSGSTVDDLDHDTGLKADLVWVKKRNNTERHILVDSVRGGNSTSNFLLYPNLAVAQEYDNVYNKNWGTLTTSTTANSRFTVDGNQGFANDGHNFVCWAWRAGGSPTADNTATSGAMTANSVSVDGALQSSYTPSGSPTIYPTRMSVNTKAGFSIIKYGGNTASSSTVPHGLGKAPEMIIIKNLDSSDQWVVYHKSVASDAETDYLVLNTTAAAVDNAAVWNDTAPTTQVFSIGHGGSISELNENFIAYCWHSVAGYSAFDSYIGNGSADGPFIYTGFKPAWIMVKCASDQGSVDQPYAGWVIYDDTRSVGTYNAVHSPMFANTTITEGDRMGSLTSGQDLFIDILSSGFKIRSAGAIETNVASENYIFACFASMPFKYSATNAR